MQEQIDDLISKLNELKKADMDLDRLEARHERMSADLKTMQDTLDHTKAELESAQSGLSASQVANVKRYDEDIFNKSKELDTLNTALRNAKTKLDGLNVEVDTAAKRHEQIEASIESIRKQHFG